LKTFEILFYSIKNELFPKVSFENLHQLFNLEEGKIILIFPIYKNFLRFWFFAGKKNKINHVYFGILIYSTFQARMLIESKEWFIDGCFSNLPKYCKQVIQITCLHPSEKTIPGAWFILNSKKEDIYWRMFSALKSSILIQLGLDLVEKDNLTIMSNMEIGLQLAIEKSFPKARLQSCYFHYIKNLWDNSKRMGLKTKSNSKLLRLFINNFKIAVHVTDESLRFYLLEKVKKYYLENNYFDLNETTISKLKEFYCYILRTFFDKKSYFSKYVNQKYFFYF